jgi:hypothetical protein
MKFQLIFASSCDVDCQLLGISPRMVYGLDEAGPPDHRRTGCVALADTLHDEKYCGTKKSLAGHHNLDLHHSWISAASFILRFAVT